MTQIKDNCFKYVDNVCVRALEICRVFVSFFSLLTIYFMLTLLDNNGKCKSIVVVVVDFSHRWERQAFEINTYTNNTHKKCAKCSHSRCSQLALMCFVSIAVSWIDRITFKRTFKTQLYEKQQLFVVFALASSPRLLFHMYILNVLIHINE